ncbi:3-deoxy-D-manno-octulosonic acid transferase [Desulfococcaceae bacterium HSG7]|nr:3-deoxy-D-manno-octulosonic acid transferase [Desulfococcaceae bacterium HSG7]
MRIKIFLFLYNLLLLSGLIAGGWLLIPLILTSSKRRQTFLYRFGIKPPSEMTGRSSKPIRKPIWVHALSVGEVLAAFPLIQALQTRFPERPLILSASTQTGYRIAVQRFSDKVAEIVYFPYDLPFCVKKTGNRIDPALMIIIETDIWPNFLHFMQTRNVPVMLVNARISENALRTYQRFGFFTKLMFGAFTTVCIQSQADVSRFIRLGVERERLELCGNIKFETQSINMNDLNIELFRQQLKIPAFDKIVVAGSTHPGEETIILNAWNRLKLAEWECGIQNAECGIGNVESGFPILNSQFRIRNSGTLLILVPRDPHRAVSVRRLCREAGLFAMTLKQWQKNGDSDSDEIPDVLIVDTIGILKKLYAIAHIAFIGGSLVNCGGHNPLEAAVFAKPILFGPDMSDFVLIRDKLIDAQAALQVSDADSLHNAFKKLLTDPSYGHKMGHNAYHILQENKGAIAKTVDAAVRCLLK